MDAAQDLRICRLILDGILSETGDLRPGAIQTLEEDRGALDELEKRLDATHGLARFDYRALQLIGLRMQCLMTRPTWRLCTSF